MLDVALERGAVSGSRHRTPPTAPLHPTVATTRTIATTASNPEIFVIHATERGSGSLVNFKFGLYYRGLEN